MAAHQSTSPETTGQHDFKAGLKSALMWVVVFGVMIVVLATAAEFFDWLPHPPAK